LLFSAAFQRSVAFNPFIFFRLTMFTLMTIILVIAAVLLILAVLIQPGKGAGLASSGFGGASSQLGNMFGVRRTTDFLQKFTIGLALGILLLIVITNKFFLDTTTSRSAAPGTGERTPITVGAEKPAALPQAPAQAPAQQQQAPAQQAPTQQTPAQQAPAQQGGQKK
jgi:preprotein translocase subunit SecG